MNHYFKESSNLLFADYNSDNKELRLMFKNKLDTIYTYQNVPLDIYEGLISSESSGKYFYSNINKKYQFITTSL